MVAGLDLTVEIQADAVEEWARTVGITLMRATADQRDAYVSSMPFAADPAYYTKVAGTERAAAAMPLISRPHIERNETGKKPVALYGIHMTDHTPVFMSPWNTNETIDITTVLGAPGSGKSYWSRTHLGRMAMAGVRTIVIDPLGDFVLWHQKNAGTVIELGPGSPIHINPLRRSKGIEVDDDGVEYEGIERIDDSIRRPEIRLRAWTRVPAPGTDSMEKRSDMRRTPGSPSPRLVPVVK
jgi:hypothetical protein